MSSTSTDRIESKHGVEWWFLGVELVRTNRVKSLAKLGGFFELCAILISLETHQKIYESECGMWYLLYSSVFWQTSFQYIIDITSFHTDTLLSETCQKFASKWEKLTIENPEH